MIAEVDARDVPGARSNYCLIRSTDAVMRRIWSYPADWHRLEEERLMALFEAPFAGDGQKRDTAPATTASCARPEHPLEATA
jgi:hypothetical protein